MRVIVPLVYAEKAYSLALVMTIWLIVCCFGRLWRTAIPAAIMGAALTLAIGTIEFHMAAGTLSWSGFNVDAVVTGMALIFALCLRQLQQRVALMSSDLLEMFPLPQVIYGLLTLSEIGLAGMLSAMWAAYGGDAVYWTVVSQVNGLLIYVTIVRGIWMTLEMSERRRIVNFIREYLKSMIKPPAQ